MVKVCVVLWPGLQRTMMTAGDREMEGAGASLEAEAGAAGV